MKHFSPIFNNLTIFDSWKAFIKGQEVTKTKQKMGMMHRFPASVEGFHGALVPTQLEAFVLFGPQFPFQDLHSLRHVGNTAIGSM